MSAIRDRQCPVCDTSGRGSNANPPFGPYMDCPKCGIFSFHFDAWQTLEGLKNSVEGKEFLPIRTLLSHMIRRTQRKGVTRYASITKAQLDEMLGRSLPTPSEQADLFVLYAGDAFAIPEGWASLPELALIAQIGAATEEGLFRIINFLRDSGQIVANLIVKDDVPLLDTQLTFKGWERYHELKKTTSESRLAFMAMKFNHANAEAMFSQHFVPAVAETGFELRRVDTTLRAGLIDTHMMVDIRNSAFVIADLSGASHGAYWEAGFAHGLNKPVIYTCEQSEEEKPHFDTNHHTTIRWSLEKPELAKRDLKAMIRNALPDRAKMTDD